MERDPQQEKEQEQAERREMIACLGRKMKELKEVEDRIYELIKVLLDIDIEVAGCRMSSGQMIRTIGETEAMLVIFESQQKSIKHTIEFFKDVLNEKW
jgi:hypothetical protein